jgi:hypothetical protein
VAANYALAGIPAQTWVSSIDPSRFDKNTVYASFDNHMYGDVKTYIAKSTDMGKTWTMFKSDEFTGFAHKIKEDNINKDLLFAGTEMGLYASLDAGYTWFRMKNNVPWKAMVRDIQIHPVTNDLILATHGRGIMIVDNITPMRSMTKEVAAKDVIIFDSKPVNLTMGKYYVGSGSGDGYIGGNSSQQAPIQYYFKDRVNTGEVKIEIYDKLGKLVQSIPGSKRRGINIVDWNMRSTPPKVASGGTKIDFGGFVAPMVLPGEYTVKLKVGDKQYENKLTMQRDPNSDMSLADMEDQYNTAMQLYNMHERLGKLVDSISIKQKMLQQYLPGIKNTKLKKTVQEYYDKLEELRGKLLASKQKSLFADEKKLREDITEVYAAVCNQETKPSNLQKERTAVLSQQVGDAEKMNASINAQYDQKLINELIKEKVNIDKPELKKTPNQ